MTLPLNTPVVLIADKLAESTVAALGDQVEVRWVDGPDRPKLLAAVADADALLVRSATTVDAEVIAAAPKLKIIARAGVGLDNVDVDAATAAGVLVVNAPTSNIHSAAEHALALMLGLVRGLRAAERARDSRTWVRDAIDHFPMLCGCLRANSLTALGARRSELPSRRTGFTALPRHLP